MKNFGQIAPALRLIASWPGMSPMVPCVRLAAGYRQGGQEWTGRVGRREQRWRPQESKQAAGEESSGG